jgi:hypothetical protein
VERVLVSNRIEPAEPTEAASPRSDYAASGASLK